MSDYYVHNGTLYSSDELKHHGIKGQKWGIRRYQNPDGTLTEEGRRKIGVTPRQKKIIGTVGGVLAAKSMSDTYKNWKTANALVEGYAKIPVSKLLSAGTLQAGKVAGLSMLATYGTMKAGELIREKTSNKK